MGCSASPSERSTRTQMPQSLGSVTGAARCKAAGMQLRRPVAVRLAADAEERLVGRRGGVVRGWKSAGSFSPSDKRVLLLCADGAAAMMQATA